MEAKPTKYTIIVRDEVFTLYKTQIEFDAPNYFTALFLGDFAEGASNTTTLTLDRNPALFSILVEYMSGYHILPLSERALPKTMNVRTALRNLVEDAAFYGLSRLHAMLSEPVQPSIDFGWTGFSGKVVTFEDVLRGNLPESVSYTTSGLCSFDSGSVRPVIIYAQNIALKLVGNTALDRSGRPEPNSSVAFYHVTLTRETKSQLERQPYSAFEFVESDPLSMVVSVFPESRIHIDGRMAIRFENFAAWWRARRCPFTVHNDPKDERADGILDEAFPRELDEQGQNGSERNEFALWGDELLFVITARGFIAGTLQLHVKLLDVRARTRAAVLDTLRPPFLQALTQDERSLRSL